MGSSDSGGGGNGLPDCSIGSIVWVRRRNGSWWPGKILGIDELSASHLMSPRSGTPVKLLGREDASVDWYNLEKSKRVKAFRCGEFDDCIERAEASLGHPSKKREKYARREDAILHALELEKELPEKGYGKPGTRSSPKNNSCGSSGKDLHTSSGAFRNGNGRHDITELLQYHKMGVSITNDECNSNLLSAQKGEGSAWHSSVKSEYNPLIGSSHDFTLPNKYGCATLSPTHKATNGDQAQAGGVFPGSYSGVDSGNSTDKGKGPLDGSVEESSIRRRDRRRPIVQVLQNSAMWNGHSLQPDGDTLSRTGVSHLEDNAQVRRQRLLYPSSQTADNMVDVKGNYVSLAENLASLQRVRNYSHIDTHAKPATSGSSEDTESDSDSSETDSMEHYMDVDINTYSDVNTPMAVQSRDLNSLEMRGDQASTSSDESDESHHDTPHFHPRDPVPLDMGVSRWKLKGKRNDRSFSRRSLDRFAYGTFLEPRSLVQRPSLNLSYNLDHDGYNDDVDFIEDDSIHLEGYGNRGHMWKSEATPRRWNISGSNMMDWDGLTWKDSSFRGYWGDGFGSFNSNYGGFGHGQDFIFDVDLKVQAYHRREVVPFVSLTSRLNGKSIIGHPIQVETLQNGATDAFVSSSDAFENFESDDGIRVPSAWATARRTSGFRVPRPHLSSYLDDVDNQLLDQDQKSELRNLASGNSHAKRNISARRKAPYVAKNLSSNRKRPPKKPSSSSSQKIRPLSSIGMGQNIVSEPRQSRLIGYMDGVIKPLDSGPPIVACIPVKLVFSRLLESIGRPPSMSSSHKGFGEQE